MTIRRVICAASLLATGALGTHPRWARAETLTLAEIEAQAQRERPELMERRASIEKANAELGAAQARTRPTLAARADVSLAPGGQLVTIPSPQGPYLVQGSRTIGDPGALTPQPRYAAVLAGKYTLLDFGRSSLGIRAAEAAISAERATLIQAKVELVRKAREAYLTWLEAHQTWRLAHSDAELTATRTANVRELIEEGARPATDATLSSYDERMARLREARARRGANAALELLGASIQRQLPVSAEPDASVLDVPGMSGATGAATPTNAAGAGAPPVAGNTAGTNTPNGSGAGDRVAGGGAAGAANPASNAAAPATGASASVSASGLDHGLEALDRQHDAALAAARAADRAVAPQLEAAAELGVQGQDEQVFPAYRASVTLSVPLLDGGAQAALAGQRRAEAMGLEAKRQLPQKQIEAQRRAAENALGAAHEELGMSLELLATAEALLAEAEEHYRAGSDTLERVLSAQRSLVAARREVLTSRLENAKARLELEPVQLRD